MRRSFASTLILLALLTPSAARTEIIEVAPPVGGCSNGATWEAVGACLAKARYKIVPLRQGTDWKLLELEVQRDPPAARRLDAERVLALYVNRANTWVLGGHVYLGGSHYEVLAMAQTTMNKRDVWKIELGQATPTRIPTNDTGATTPALVRYNRTIYCGGTQPSCSDVYTACEVLVRGRAWYAFRGTARPIDGDATAIEVAGDRNRSGNLCRMPERVSLYLP